MPDVSACGCQWTRTREYGDVIVKQCERHARGEQLSAKERDEALHVVLDVFRDAGASVRMLK